MKNILSILVVLLLSYISLASGKTEDSIQFKQAKSSDVKVTKMDAADAEPMFKTESVKRGSEEMVDASD